MFFINRLLPLDGRFGLLVCGTLLYMKGDEKDELAMYAMADPASVLYARQRDSAAARSAGSSAHSGCSIRSGGASTAVQSAIMKSATVIGKSCVVTGPAWRQGGPQSPQSAGSSPAEPSAPIMQPGL
eukprot:scaffold661147_cov66-Prasinocladus_malaysianus.AAC.1